MRLARYFGIGLVALLALPFWGTLHAAKPGGSPPPPPPPAGTIFFGYQGSETFRVGMRADGTGKRTASEFSDAPSSLVYGLDPVLDRWCLTVAETTDGLIYPGTVNARRREVFAVKAHNDGMGMVYEWVQVTNLYPDINVISSATWSNDGADSFISFAGMDVQTRVRHIYRVAVSGFDVEGATGTSEPDGLGGLARIENLETVVTNEAGLVEAHNWSPDGASVVYPLQISGPVFDERIYVTHVPTGETRLCFDPPGFAGNARWCPDPANNRILLNDSGDLWTIAPDGSGLVRILKKSTKESYWYPRWSPNGQHVLYQSSRTAGANYTQRFMARIPAAGGTATVLTGDLDPLQVGGATSAWVADVLAP